MLLIKCVSATMLLSVSVFAVLVLLAMLSPLVVLMLPSWWYLSANSGCWVLHECRIIILQVHVYIVYYTVGLLHCCATTYACHRWQIKLLNQSVIAYLHFLNTIDCVINVFADFNLLIILVLCWNHHRELRWISRTRQHEKPDYWGCLPCAICLQWILLDLEWQVNLLAPNRFEWNLHR